MTIAELIARLQTYNQQKQVFVTTDNGCSALVDYFEEDSIEGKEVIYLHIEEQE